MYILFRIFGVLTIILDRLIAPVYWLFSFRWTSKVPPVTNEILLLSATELARKIRQKKLLSEVVIQTYIERIKVVNPIINAVADERFADALQDARNVDNYIKQNFLSADQLQLYKPFFGVPITIKETCGLEGMSQAAGLVSRTGIKSATDCVSVKRLKKAGFIPLLVSTTPEFCLGLETNTLITGLTRNPYNTNKVAGGSSGGEAALLSSAASVVGLGTDFAGSIRIPCMFVGIFGHKPTSRIIPRTGHFPESADEASHDFFSLGPMARYAEDLRPILKIISAEEGIKLNLDQKVNISNLKIFSANNDYNILGIIPTDKKMRNGVEKSMEYLNAKFGSKTGNLDLPDLRDGIEIATSLYMNLKDVPDLLEDPKDPKISRNLYMEIVKSLFGLSHLTIYTLLFMVVHRCHGFMPKKYFPHYKNQSERLKKQIQETLGDNGVLLYPTFPTSAFQHYQVFTKTPGVTYSMIFNVLGCPATQVPIGFDSNNLPIGIQVVAAPNQDRLCLAVAEELEKLFGGWVPPYSI